MTALSSKQEGDALYREGRFESAVRKYTAAIDACRTPDNSDIHLAYSNRCACYLQLGNLGLALDDAIRCTSLKPNWVKGYSRKAACLIKLNRAEDAISCYEKVLQLDNSNMEAQNFLRNANRSSYQQNSSSNTSYGGGNGGYRGEHSAASAGTDYLGRAQDYLQVGWFGSGAGYYDDYSYGGYGGYGGGYYGGGGMSWTMWGMIMLAAYKIPPMLPDLLGDQFARPFFGMSWTTFMWLLSMFNRNARGMGGGGFGGYGGGFGGPRGGMYGRRRYY